MSSPDNMSSRSKPYPSPSLPRYILPRMPQRPLVPLKQINETYMYVTVSICPCIKQSRLDAILATCRVPKERKREKENVTISVATGNYHGCFSETRYTWCLRHSPSLSPSELEQNDGHLQWFYKHQMSMPPPSSPTGREEAQERIIYHWKFEVVA